jgi:hypothetical protein
MELGFTFRVDVASAHPSLASRVNLLSIINVVAWNFWMVKNGHDNSRGD